MDGEAPGALSQASQPWAPAEKTLSHMVPKVSPPPGVCGGRCSQRRGEVGRGAGRRHISLTWMQRDPPAPPMPNQVALKEPLNSQVTVRRCSAFSQSSYTARPWKMQTDREQG